MPRFETVALVLIGLVFLLGLSFLIGAAVITAQGGAPAAPTGLHIVY